MTLFYDILFLGSRRARGPIDRRVNSYEANREIFSRMRTMVHMGLVHQFITHCIVGEEELQAASIFTSFVDSSQIWTF